MNRFEYADPRFMPNEVYVRCDMIVRLYDGDIKVIILWGDTICDWKDQFQSAINF